jgi:DNA-binding transcriptional regulator YdaS (Cro superfamily)
MSKKALNRAIQLVGRKTIADACCCTPDNVSNWLRRGGVPANKCFAVAKATGWRVSMHQLNESAFPENLIPASQMTAYQGKAVAIA